MVRGREVHIRIAVIVILIITFASDRISSGAKEKYLFYKVEWLQQLVLVHSTPIGTKAHVH